MGKKSSNFLCYPVLFMLFLVPSLGLTLDGTLLLSFKYSILDDPLSVLDNWNYEDQTPCLWTGVTCGQVQSPFGIPDLYRVVSLVLPNSKILGSVPEDLGLIQNLRTLDLSNNFLNGTLPISLFNASQLQVLSLSGNDISGGLPEFIAADGRNLKVLNLSANALSGNLPENISFLQNLTVVSLRSNSFSGRIPGGFQFIEVLDLSENLLNGSLPDDFGGERLKYLNLSSNQFSGLISPDFAKKIPANVTIDLSFNKLTGEIPQSMAFSNQKPESFQGNLELCGKPLKKLCTIPSTLSAPPNTSSTNGSSPAIAAIPKTFDTAPLQSNSPEATTNSAPQRKLKPGTIVGIVVGDLAGIGVLAILCVYMYQLKKKKFDADKEIKDKSGGNGPKEIKDSQFSIAKDTTTTTRSHGACSSCLQIRNGEETSESSSSSDSDENNIIEIQQDPHHDKEKKSLVMIDGETELELETLLKASAYILGSTASSIVYKAVLDDGTSFAVRRIGEGGVERFKDFEHQIKAISKLRHPNLVRIRGFYWGNDEKLVIHDYISNGSLANSGGYRKTGSSPYHMDLEVRLKIARGVARGLSYIHEKRQVHGNLKPSNILLTPEMEPIISDFGLHWLTTTCGHGKHGGNKLNGSIRHFGSKRCASTASGNPDDGNGTSPYISPAGFMGCTSRYHAPESLKNLKPNPKWDVYSFGIILLELLTGKVFSDRELGQWTSSGMVPEDKNRVLKMTDVALRGDVENREEAILECFKLGFNCASLIAQKRPSMKDAHQVLDKIPCSSH